MLALIYIFTSTIYTQLERCACVGVSSYCSVYSEQLRAIELQSMLQVGVWYGIDILFHLGKPLAMRLHYKAPRTVQTQAVK